jgi:hypothetical protein
MTRRWWFAALLGLLAIGEGPSPGQGPTDRVPAPISSPFDPRVEPVRLAAPSWESRQGPERAVVDQVCLVPDFATFLQAVASWDQGHYFPVLIDDIETSFRFIRAFRPARIVRMPKASAPIPASKLWDRAVEAVGASWTNESASKLERPRGDVPPKTLGPTPPGVVISQPTAPMLAGAVALAAGRFQPLLRLDSAERFADVITPAQADRFARVVAGRVEGVAPKYEGLGDDCDFVTIAGDYPYRYQDPKVGMNALDDRLGRQPGTDRRWAFAGRLLGDATLSAYRAMCSLFLQPDSALLFNAYQEEGIPWSLYATRTAAQRLGELLPTSQVSGLQSASLVGWHETFDPSNPFGLLMINSMGGPGVFNIRGSNAFATDIPLGVPSAVLMIHSYSAADPNDPTTIAGRWLANGSFLYYGSIDEPYLDAFRTPRLIAELLSLRVPVIAAVRQVPGESRGLPWKLEFLGDPLYRVKSRNGPATPRIATWDVSAGWPTYAMGLRPVGSFDPDLFTWLLKAALIRMQTTNGGQPVPSADDLAEAALAIRRDRLPEAFRPVFDALSTELLLVAKKRGALKSRLVAIPESRRTPAVRRTIEALEGVDFYLAVSRNEPSKARLAWLELLKSSTPDDFKQQAMSSVSQLCLASPELDAWRTTLQTALGNHLSASLTDAITAELKRIDELLKKPR